MDSLQRVGCATAVPRGYAVCVFGYELEQVRQYIREQESADGTDGKF